MGYNLLRYLKYYLWVFVVLVNSLSAQTSSNLLFKSSFDNIVVDKTVSWNHHLSGTDSVTSFTFPTDLPGDYMEHYFNYVVGDMNNYFDYANAEIVNTTGFDGNPTNALYLNFIKDDTNFISYSRVQYAMYGDSLSNNPVQRMNQGYIKYKIKTHLDHADQISDWRLPIEWKDMDDDGFRMGLYIYDTNTPSPYWVAKGQYMVNGLLGNDVWQFDNYTIPVKEDDWFELEAYWYANADSSLGKLKIAIDGQLLFDVTNQTKDPNHPNKMFYFMPFKVYGTVGYSWITDFEYRDIPPINSVLSNNPTLMDENVGTIDNVYPNPTTGTVFISNQFFNKEFEVISVSGTVVKKGVIKKGEIDLSELRSNIYLIKVFKNKIGEYNLYKIIKN